MADFDVFNGDADGICALHQLRLAEPRDAELITGVKRDIALLRQACSRVSAGDRVTVVDISVEPNRGALDDVLARGARVQWFDHHHPGELPLSAALEARIDLSADVCSSLIVDRFLGGRFHAWAIVAAFGDGLKSVGDSLAAEAGYGIEEINALMKLGEAVNYNAYGETIDDLLVPPAYLYRMIARYDDPFAFARHEPVAGELCELMARDLAIARTLAPAMSGEFALAYLLPDEPWARRISGPFANLVAEINPGRAVAVLTRRTSGDLQVSVRAPRSNPGGAADLCRKYPTGGGRNAAGGINRLEPVAIDGFLEDFARHFEARMGEANEGSGAGQ